MNPVTLSHKFFDDLADNTFKGYIWKCFTIAILYTLYSCTSLLYSPNGTPSFLKLFYPLNSIKNHLMVQDDEEIKNNYFSYSRVQDFINLS